MENPAWGAQPGDPQAGSWASWCPHCCPIRPLCPPCVAPAQPSSSIHSPTGVFLLQEGWSCARLKMADRSWLCFLALVSSLVCPGERPSPRCGRMRLDPEELGRASKAPLTWANTKTWRFGLSRCSNNCPGHSCCASASVCCNWVVVMGERSLWRISGFEGKQEHKAESFRIVSFRPHS